MLRVFLRVLLMLCCLLLAGAAPASAHDAAEHGAPGIGSDVRSVPVSSSLPPGVELQVLQNGQAVRLVNSSARPVTVPGQDLRVPPGGALQWHEDAAHPSDVVGPDRPTRAWEITVIAGGVTHVVTGELRWTAGPSPLPWFAAAAALALAAVASRSATVPLLVATAASVAVTALAFAARTGEGPRSALLGSYLPPAACWAMALLCVASLVRGRRDGAALGVLAAAALVLLTLVGSAPALWSSTVIAAGPDWLARALVVTALGSAAGSLVALAARARADASPARRP